MRHAALFNGIGGFQIAAQAVGWENVMSCEIDPFCNQVTKYHFPNCKQEYDIRETDFTIYRGTIDVLTGGFPCQPFSVAGKRKGTDDERHLWPEMLRAIREIAPAWIVGENVRGLTNWNGGMVFDKVQADLENLGYEVQSFVLPACSVNAPHRRDRVWFVAKNTKCDGRLCGEFEQEGAENGKFGDFSTRDSNGICEQKDAWITSNANSQQRPKGRLYQARPEEAERYLSAFRSRNDWRTWEDFPTQSPICGGDDGLPTELDGITFSKWRQESIKAYGNAIVPQVAVQIFKAIIAYEQRTT